MENLTHLPTSDKYILSKIKTNIIVYSKLKNYKNIDDIFINNSCIILYNEKRLIGHWVAIIKRQNTISYFDSYGRIPDHPYYEGTEFPYLSMLLLKCKYILEYNECNLQKSNTSTCGHHCIVRILFKDKPLSEYHNFMKKFKNDDDLVTFISKFLI